MNSLEFIEKEIEKEKITIRVNTSLLSQFDNEDDVANNVLLTKIMIAENRLKILEQIKSELEAWDFTKRELGLKVIERNCGMFGSRYALKCDYEDSIPLLDKEVESFKKALEVEDE